MISSLRRRTSALILGLGMAILGLSACADTNSMVATVGDRTITVDEFEQAIQAAYADPIVGQGLKDYGPAYRTLFLNEMVQGETIKQIAANEGITYTPQEVEEYLVDSLDGMSVDEVQEAYKKQGQFLAQEHIYMRAEQNFVMSKLGEAASGKTLADLEAENLAALKAEMAQTPGIFDSFQIGYVLPQDEATAQEWYNQLSSGAATIIEIGEIAGPIQGLPQPQMAQLTGDQAQQQGLLEQLAPLQKGSFGILSNGQQSIVIQVMNRETATEESIAQNARQAAQSQFAEAGAVAAAKSADKIDIEINPRYGELERPEQGLPSVADSTPTTFGEPTQEAPAGVPTLPGQ